MERVGRASHESWNDFDLGYCYDVYLEPLSNGNQLVVCGDGQGMRDGSTISVTLNGSVWIQEGGRQSPVCKAAHQFTFTRASAAAESR